MNKQERLKYENEARTAGYSRILGVDEAGRGPMAGPLVVGGVIFPEDFYDERINDSKKLTEKKREELYTSTKNRVEYLPHNHLLLYLFLIEGIFSQRKRKIFNLSLQNQMIIVHSVLSVLAQKNDGGLVSHQTFLMLPYEL